MILELLFLALLVFGVCLVAYKGAIHEFQILQKTYSPDQEWSDVCSEQLPIVIRDLPRPWLGMWTRQKTEHKTWLITVRNTDGKKYKTTWNNWLNTPSPRPVPLNMDEIAEVAKLQSTLGHWRDDGFRRWSWLPSGAPTPAIYNTSDIQGVQKSRAEYTAIVSTDGTPLELWLAHEGAIPDAVAEDLMGKDPWIQTTDEIPWIGEVKYIEIKLRPGNAVLIPRHWYYAIRTAGEGDAWFWQGAFHTPVSWVVNRVASRTVASTV